MKSIYNNDFAYLVGNFCADGSFYKDSSGYRFEFVDGSPYENELKYSLGHILKIKKIIKNYLGLNLPKIRKRGHRFVLSFRNKTFSDLFVEFFGFLPGDKSRIIDIPEKYRNTSYEKSFWIGFLDGDGSIARKSKRLAVESMSKKIIKSFAEYLDKMGIYYSNYESKRGNEKSYVLLIRSISFKNFADKIGFYHPLKSSLLKEKLMEREFYNVNEIDETSLGKPIDYIQIFDNSIFLKDGRELLLKYGYTKYHRNNVSVMEIFELMKKKGLPDKKILGIIGKYRFKKSKGSMNSVALPLTFTYDLLKLAKFVRIRAGGISFSRRYIESFKEDYSEILDLAEKIFDIKPKYTCKNEPLFCSGVLADLFKSVIK